MCQSKQQRCQSLLTMGQDLLTFVYLQTLVKQLQISQNVKSLKRRCHQNSWRE